MKLIANKRTDDLEQNIWQREDGTYFRLLNEVEIETDCNGDVWFTISESLLDTKPQPEHIGMLVDIAKSLNFDVENKTFRELFSFVNIDNDIAEIKSGFYPVNKTTRAYETPDIEFELWCSYFYNGDNVDIKPKLINDDII